MEENAKRVRELYGKFRQTQKDVAEREVFFFDEQIVYEVKKESGKDE